MAAACRPAVLLGKHFLGRNRFESRAMSELVKSNGKGFFPVNTFALVRRLESEGVPTKQAEALTKALTDVFNDSWELVSDSLVEKAEMEKNKMTQETNLAKFITEFKSSQDHHFSLLQHETEKCKADIEKIRSGLRYEMDKVIAGQRLDFNLEKGRIRDELNNQNQGTINLTNKLEREIQAMRAQWEAAKSDVVKYCIGTIVSASAVGLAVIRILM